MRKIIVLMFMSLDGVIQGPGGPKEDTSGGFKYGGWVAPYFDGYAGKIMDKQMTKKVEYLLGRKTFEIFSSYWPKHDKEWPMINKMKKYAVSKTLKKSDWENSYFLKNLADVKKLKKSKGPDLHMYGSADLIQTLLENDLVDELWLKIFPITLGKGKRLFAEGTIPRSFKLVESSISPKGVIFANYKKVGIVKTGTVG